MVKDFCKYNNIKNSEYTIVNIDGHNFISNENKIYSNDNIKTVLDKISVYCSKDIFKKHIYTWYQNNSIYDSLSFNYDYNIKLTNPLDDDIDKIFLGIPTSTAMMVMTLGSVPFYIRNIVSNLLFFGPAQGLWPTPKSIANT